MEALGSSHVTRSSEGLPSPLSVHVPARPPAWILLDAGARRSTAAGPGGGPPGTRWLAAAGLLLALGLPLAAADAEAAVTVNFIWGTLSITGDTGDDNVAVTCDGVGKLFVNGNPVAGGSSGNVLCNEVTTLNISTGGGNDTVDLTSVDLGLGELSSLTDCTVGLGEGDDALSSRPLPCTASGEGGSDTLHGVYGGVSNTFLMHGVWLEWDGGDGGDIADLTTEFSTLNHHAIEDLRGLPGCKQYEFGWDLLFITFNTEDNVVTGTDDSDISLLECTVGSTLPLGSNVAVDLLGGDDIGTLRGLATGNDVTLCEQGCTGGDALAKNAAPVQTFVFNDLTGTFEQIEFLIVDMFPSFTGSPGNSGDDVLRVNGPLSITLHADLGDETAADLLIVDAQGENAVHEGTTITFPDLPSAGPINYLDAETVQILNVLPVELVSFEALAEDGGVVLAWRTLSETNNAGFSVEGAQRREHGVNDAWREVAFVAGHGTTTAPQAYTYRVAGLAPGRYAFRLKQVDYDGAFAYSPEAEAVVDLEGAFEVTAAFPNPFRDATTLQLTVREAQHVRVEVYDALGRRVELLHDGVLAAHTPHRLTFSGQPLSGGYYFFRIQGAGFQALRSAVRHP